jgi:hypothetical protein
MVLNGKTKFGISEIFGKFLDEKVKKKIDILNGI